MSKSKSRKQDPAWVSEIEGLEVDFYDSSGELYSGKDLQLSSIEDAEYVSLDNVECVDERPLATGGIFHCVGVVAQGEEICLGHLTPGEAGETVDEVLYGVEQEFDQITYAVGGSPDLELLNEAREHFSGDERIIYTGRSGNIAVDSSGEIYSFEKEEEKGPLSGTI